MSLHDKLKKVKDKSEEKTIALRIPKGKALILEKLAEYYELNTSALIREMIDDAIVKLQRDLIVLPEEMGLKNKASDAIKNNITYLPDVIEILSEDLGRQNFQLDDFCDNVEAYEHFVLENARLSVEYGMSLSSTGITPITNKEYHFPLKPKDDEE